MIFTELRFQDPATKTYLGSPSIVRLGNGDLLATHDYFGPGCPRNHENEEHLTSVYRSADDGETWRNVTHIANAYWSNLFILDDAVYLLGTSQQYGSIVIRRSEDGGNTWTHPADGKSGWLFPGGAFRDPPNYHCAPVPILIKDNRLYRAFEDFEPTTENQSRWVPDFKAAVISIRTDADLLDASNWTMSNKLRFEPTWSPEEREKQHLSGWLEGNVVETPSGEIWNILRFNSDMEKAAIVRVSEQGSRITFDPKTGFIDFPGGITKFTIRRDEKSGLYLTLSNGSPNPEKPTRRSVLSLYKSRDLRQWEHLVVLLRDDSGLSYEESIRSTGFQYVDWQFDGEDIIYLVRTAYNGAHNYHDSNRITYHKLRDFRKMI